MTDLRTAAQQALALICSARLCEVNSMSSRQEMLRLLIEATDTLRAALAEPVQEPVAWMHIPYPGSGLRQMVSLIQNREPSLYAASVPLFLKEQL